jgi:hypothetical protein
MSRQILRRTVATAAAIAASGLALALPATASAQPAVPTDTSGPDVAFHIPDLPDAVEEAAQGAADALNTVLPGPSVGLYDVEGPTTVITYDRKGSYVIDHGNGCRTYVTRLPNKTEARAEACDEDLGL